MADIAALGLEIKSDGAVEASKNLDKMSESAAKAEIATLSLSSATKASSASALGATRVIAEQAQKTDVLGASVREAAKATAGVVTPAALASAETERLASAQRNAAHWAQGAASAAEVLAAREKAGASASAAHSKEQEHLGLTSKGAAADLRGLGSAVAAIDGPLGGIASRFRSLGTLINQAGLGLAAAALVVAGSILGLKHVFGEYVDETVQAEAASMRLNTALASTGGAAGITRDSLDSMARSLRNVTTFSDNSIKEVQGTLLTFTNIGGKIFERVTLDILDMAQALGESATSAAHRAGIALNDPIRGMLALSRSGVQFTQHQRSMVQALVQSGQGLQAQEIVLKALEQRFGGTAKAAKDTLGGALSDLSNSWKETFRVLGTSSESLRKAIEKLAETLDSPAFQEFAQKIGSMVFNALASVLALLNSTLAVLPAVSQAVLTLGEAWLLVKLPSFLIAGASALAGLIGVEVAVTSLAGAIGVFGGAILGYALKPIALLIDGLRALAVAAVANPFGFIAGAIAVGAVAIYNYRDEIKAFFSDLEGWGKDSINNVIRFFDVLVSDFGAGISRLWGYIRHPLTEQQGSFGQDLSDIAKRAQGTDYLGNMKQERLGQSFQTTVAPASGLGNGANDFNSGGSSGYQQAIESIRERTQALQAEAQMVGRSSVEQDRYLKQIELENVAKKDGLGLSPQRAAQILAEADAYARAGAAKRAAELKDDIGFSRAQLGRSDMEQSVFDRMKSAGLLDNGKPIDATAEAMIRLDGAIKAANNSAQTFTSGFLHDLYDGKSAIDALSDALKNFGARLLDLGVNNVFNSIFGNGGAGANLVSLATGRGQSNGILGGYLIPGVLAEGGPVTRQTAKALHFAVGGEVIGSNVTPSPLAFASGGLVKGPGTGTSDSIPARLSDGEFVATAASTKRYLPVLQAINSGMIDKLASSPNERVSIAANMAAAIAGNVSSNASSLVQGDNFKSMTTQMLSYHGGALMSGMGNVPAYVSNGEFIVGSAAAQTYAPLLKAMNDNSSLAPSSFRDGGVVGSGSSSAPSSRYQPSSAALQNVGFTTSKAAEQTSVHITVAPTFHVENGTSEGVDKMKADIVPIMEKTVQKGLNEFFARNPLGMRLLRNAS